MKYKLLFLLLFTFAIFAVSCSDGRYTDDGLANAPSGTPVNVLPRPVLNEVELGKKVFEMSCVTCHKSDGTGGDMELNGKMKTVPSLASASAIARTDEDLILTIMHGNENEGMPPFESRLSEGELRDVVAFIRREVQKK